MDFKELISYIQAGATNTTFFASKVTHENEIGPILSAMANTQGGKIFIGVDLTNCHLVNVNFKLEWIKELIERSCSPYINVLIDTLERNNQTVFCITIPEGSEKPYHFKNKVYVMEESNCRLATYDEVKSFKLAPKVTPVDSTKSNLEQHENREGQTQKLKSKSKSMLDMAAEAIEQHSIDQANIDQANMDQGNENQANLDQSFSQPSSSMSPDQTLSHNSQVKPSEEVLEEQFQRDLSQLQMS